MIRSLLPVLLLVAVAFAGCSDDAKPDSQTGDPKDPGKLKEGTGAIAGLLLDDRYRPIADGRVLLEQTGQRTQSNANGEFYFVDLEPGTYRLRAEVEGHEALPMVVQVEKGFFAEERLVARRVVDNSGSIITQEYAVFIPCAADYIANGGNIPCSLDFGNNEYSSNYIADLSGFDNVTYVVTEFKANQQNDYEVQVRDDSGSPWIYYGVSRFSGDYTKIVLKVGEANTEDQVAVYGENQPFTVEHPFRTIFFVDHADAKDLVPGTCCGLGASMGIKGTFVQSIFLGEPQVPIESYAVYS